MLSARRPRWVVRGLGRAFLYLSICGVYPLVYEPSARQDARGGDRRVRTELITSLEAAPWDEGGWKRKGLIQQRAAKFRKRDDDTAFVASLAKVAPPANAMVRLRGDGFYRARGGVVAVLEQYRLPARALRRVPRCSRAHASCARGACRSKPKAQEALQVGRSKLRHLAQTSKQAGPRRPRGCTAPPGLPTWAASAV